MREQDRGSLFADANSKHAPVVTFHMAVRAQPHEPQVAAPLSVLAAGNGLLFAAPTQAGGFAVWARADTKVAVRSGSLLPVRFNRRHRYRLCEAGACGEGA
jgi:hypothetical protein